MTISAIVAVTALARSRLLYVPMQIGGEEVEALVNTGAIHLFISECMAVRLGLRTSPSEDRVKIVYTAEQWMVGVAFNVPMELGQWTGRHHVRVARMDDYEVVLGMELLRRVKASVVPHLEGVQVLHEKAAGWIPDIQQGSLVDSTSDVQGTQSVTDPSNPWVSTTVILVRALATGMRRQEVTYIVVVAAIELECLGAQEVPAFIADLLEEFQDLMPKKLPKGLPP